MANILIVDDEQDITDLLQFVLEKEGHKVSVAANGNQAIAFVKKENNFDLVVTDLLMPEKDGIETITEIRNLSGDLKVMAISAGGRCDSRLYLDAAVALGADATLKKPFSMDLFRETVRKLLDS